MSSVDAKKIPTAIVIGAGPAGLSVSLGLSYRGWKVNLIEKYNSFEIRGASFGLASNGIKALEEIHPGTVEEKMIGAGRAVKLPSGGLLLPWWMMRDALLEQVQETKSNNNSTRIGIDLHMGLLVESILDESELVKVKFTNGETIEGDLVIGADGVHSSVREILGLPKNQLTGSKVFRGSVEVKIQLEEQDSDISSSSHAEQSVSLLERMLTKGMVPLSATYPGMHFFVLNFHPHIKGRMCWVFSTKDPSFNAEQTSIQSFVRKHESNEEKLANILAILNASTEGSLSSYTETKVTDFSDDILSQYDGRWGGKVSEVTLCVLTWHSFV